MSSRIVLRSGPGPGWIAAAVVSVVLSSGLSCGSKAGVSAGGEGGPCRAGGVCAWGLNCVFNLCVRADGLGGSPATGAGGGVAGAPGDGGQGGGGGAGGITGAGGRATSCSGCRADQICVGGACTDVPPQCPCPRETYCDLAAGHCTIGCAQDSDCAVGRICNTTARTCFDGCRQDQACGGAGQICDATAMACRAGCRVKSDCAGGLACINTVCAAGCATTSDCTATGQTCLNNACACPAGDIVCSGACVATNTVQNCGGCGMACQPNQSCVGNQCTCPPGTCQPEVVYTSHGSLPIDGFWIDGGYVYALERTTPYRTMYRAPLAGGAVTTVGGIGLTPYYITVGTGNVVFNDPLDLNNNTTGSNLYLYQLPGAGGKASRIDLVYSSLTSGSQVGVDATSAYWFTWDTGTTINLWRIPLGFGSTTQMLGTVSTEPTHGIFIQGTTLYFGTAGGSDYKIQRAVGTAGITNIATGTGTLHDMFVDKDGVYFSDQSNTVLSNKRIMRMNLDGTNPVVLSSTLRSNMLVADATNLYFLQIDATPIPIFRVPKAGGAAPSLFYTPPAQTVVRVADGYVYFQANNQVVRLATSYRGS